MDFLVDEDVVALVSHYLAKRGHLVELVVDVLGSGTKDPTIRQYQRAQLAAGRSLVLVTANGEFARRVRQPGSRLPCLWLRDLRALEQPRVEQLIEVIEREHALLGNQFFMEIRESSYTVTR